MGGDMYETILYSADERIARITLNRPDARNALSDRMIGELLDAFERAKADPEVRVIVLTGAGDRAFCAGADLGGLGAAQADGRSVADAAAIRESAPFRLFTAFPKLGKPIIARLAGHAVAGGLGLAAACDLVIAADDVKLATPEVDVGLWPMMIMAIINRNVPPKHAFRLYYTGARVTAAEGRDIGLVTEVVPRADLDARVDELARVIASKSPVGLRRGRDAFFAIEGRPLEDQVAHLLSELVELTATEDAKEGITAFLENRRPDFQGR